MRRATAFVTAFVLAATAALTACGDQEEQAGGVLRIGYQRFGGLSLVKARGDVPGVEWSLFESGPALTEAIKAGAIDLGQTGEAPPIFAAAAKTEFVVAAAGAPSPRSEAVLVKKSRGFKTFADLKGRTIALNKGSNVHWLLVRLLEANKLTLADVNVKYLKPAEGRPAFDNDQVDAWIIWDPYFALAERPDVQVLADATGVANNREYILVSKDAAEAKTDQIKSFLAAYEKTTAWGIANPDERAKVLAPELKIDEPTTKRALARAAQPVAPLTPEIGDELQGIADGFTELKLIPVKVDVKSLIDSRFGGTSR
ncbi:aliphatic sulfonate ABC transporter substrate-binding protein [Actinoplanes sp. NBRC 103695]|uniref:aliphatic sulfonate ABC transporter substrate-binding protein n=1 Tax=Actinoplanes sp. NBRC 103695 TaxID=3032202 RepID=UPI0024A140A2|nr:aliphatic sulfonate ABC transporter substrate-binding protein [Actinoplanes sp. NBRC 103695]GLZ01958.1 sulfonate ABC transporter substrate-binding protein [Actinoplanes sp. NBRC 103695]